MFLAGQHIATYQIEKKGLEPINEMNFAWGIYDYFMSSDNKKLFIAVATDYQWKKFCEGFGLESLITDEKFSSNTARYMHRDFLIPLIQKKLLYMNYEEIKNILDNNNVTYDREKIGKIVSMIKDESAIRGEALPVKDIIKIADGAI